VLPGELAQLSNLQVMNMSSNLLTGAIPTTLRKMAGLRVLALDQNAITGSFPVWLTSPALETLSLSSNFLSGVLNVSGFKNLRVLVVSNNLLSGKLPSAISSLQNLQILSLAHNRFTGAVPRLENLRNLTSLNLGGNALGPGFPALGAQIVSVFMGQNRFSGPVPSCFKGSVELQALDVSGNAMVGTPPPFLFNLPRIASLNLARNHFSGDLPGNLTLSKALSSVDVSGNFFSGRPPLVFLASPRNVSVHFQGNCMETRKQKQGSEEYCTVTAAKLGIRDGHIRSHLVLIIAVAAAGGLCLSVFLCVVVYLVARRCGGDQDRSVAAPEDGNFGSFRGIPSELLSNASMTLHISQSLPNSHDLCPSTSLV
jgi:Leucine-rich repeat (LRR) protein